MRAASVKLEIRHRIKLIESLFITNIWHIFRLLLFTQSQTGKVEAEDERIKKHHCQG